MTDELPSIRILRPGDEDLLEAFLSQHIDSSLFLLSNRRAAGLEDRGERFQGTYAAAFDNDEISGVAALYWNGSLVVQAPVHAAGVARAAFQAASRSLLRFIGPLEQVQAVMDTLGVTSDALQWDDPQGLYSLLLDALAVPDSLTHGRLRGRQIRPRDLDLLTAWRVASRIEMEGATDTSALQQEARDGLERYLATGRQWVVEVDGAAVSTCTFNAEIAEVVQVGGVYTPPEQRSRGYARAVVAAALLDARAEGVRRAILFTGQENQAAQKAYLNLGFERIGAYRLAMLRLPITTS